ncbi:MAG: putative sugar nucleotidyl transferase [Planctomycetota bacterium]|jgi:UDP-N-acetylglucosamine diphosphorylase/glucosamine-1-phosphate N-acetyltransferase
MRLILVDSPEDVRGNFYPLALSRPLWELRCGFTSLGDKLTVRVGVGDAAYFVADYMADAYRAKVKRPVNDPSVLDGDDLLIVDPRVKADSFDVAAKGPSEVGLDEQGSVLYARVAKADLAKLPRDEVGEFTAAAKAKLPNVRSKLPTWQYIWDLVLANNEQITADFAAAGRSGIEGTVEQPSAIRGNKKDVYIAPGVTVHPMVVIDAEDGPVYIDEDAEIHPFSRIEGPCYIGRKSVLLGAKCREGNSIGPLCRIGGEVEESIIQGYSNKYHDGFIGHAYIGEWVNLGALTSNSDLKNDYSTVSVMLDGRRAIDTGSTKVGSLIGDHAKTSIGTLLNTGSYVGAMALIMTTGKLLPKFIPSFAWFVEGIVTKGFGKGKLYETAKMAMSRRNHQWSEVEQSMWDAVFKMTAPERDEAIKKGRRAMLTR